MAGAAGLVSIPAIIAACSTPAASGGECATPPPRRRASAPAATAGASAATGSVDLRLELLGPRHRHEGACRPSSTRSPPETGITVKVNTVDHNTFQDQISQYLQGTPDDVFTWFAGLPHAVLRRPGPGDRHHDVWAEIERNYSEAFKASSTGNDGKQYFVPFYNYPWVVFYRKSVFTEKGYTVPTTWDEFKTLGDKMQADGLDPARASATRTAGRRWARSTSSTCGSTATSSTST